MPSRLKGGTEASLDSARSARSSPTVSLRGFLVCQGGHHSTPFYPQSGLCAMGFRAQRASITPSKSCPRHLKTELPGFHKVWEAADRSGSTEPKLSQIRRPVLALGGKLRAAIASATTHPTSRGDPAQGRQLDFHDEEVESAALDRKETHVR